jgi:DNA (cytosine-5)-methyltransferase 1
MFYHFVRAVNIIRPEWIMGENVSGLLTRKNDDGESSVIETIQNHFNDIGYNIVFNVYDLSTIGVPQTRKRLVIIGNRLSIQLQLPKFNEPKRGIVDIIEPVLEGAIETTLELPEYCYITIPDTVEITGTPHPFLVLKHEANQISYGKRESPNHSEILDLRNPCKTIICAYTFQPRLYVGLKKENGKTFIRCLTITEAAQIQGFPKTHKFHGNYSQIIKQIGNAVPPLFIQRMTELILQHS